MKIKERDLPASSSLALASLSLAINLYSPWSRGLISQICSLCIFPSLIIWCLSPWTIIMLFLSHWTSTLSLLSSAQKTTSVPGASRISCGGLIISIGISEKKMWNKYKYVCIWINYPLKLVLMLNLSFQLICTFHKKSSPRPPVFYSTSIFTFIIQPTIFYNEPMCTSIFFKFVSERRGWIIG